MSRFKRRSFPPPLTVYGRVRIARCVVSEFPWLRRSGDKRGFVRLKRPATRFFAYFLKMFGSYRLPHDYSIRETIWSFMGAIVGMAAVGLLHAGYLGRYDHSLTVGSFGASCMLVFGAPHAMFAQPRNVIGGHFISAVAGVFVQTQLGHWPWMAACVAVALAIAAMHLTGTLHPPGGATALIAVIGSDELKKMGFWYCLHPVASGVVLLVIVGIFFNNLSSHRRYPISWM